MPMYQKSSETVRRAHGKNVPDQRTAATEVQAHRVRIAGASRSTTGASQVQERK